MINKLKELYEELVRDNKFIVIRVNLYYDKKSLKKLNLKKKDSIYLFKKNIKMKRLSTKLNYTKLKSFKIKKVLKPLIYKFKLSDYIKNF